jgi:hypothetical protein
VVACGRQNAVSGRQRYVSGRQKSASGRHRSSVVFMSFCHKLFFHNSLTSKLTTD